MEHWRLRRLSSAVSATSASPTKRTTLPESQRSSSEVPGNRIRGKVNSPPFFATQERKYEAQGSHWRLSDYDVHRRHRASCIACANLGGHDGGGENRQSAKSRDAGERQTSSKGEWGCADGTRPAARDVRDLSLCPAAQWFPQGAGSLHPAGRVGDDHLRGAGLSRCGSARLDHPTAATQAGGGRFSAAIRHTR